MSETLKKTFVGDRDDLKVDIQEWIDKEIHKWNEAEIIIELIKRSN